MEFSGAMRIKDCLASDPQEYFRWGSPQHTSLTMKKLAVDFLPFPWIST
jgi:hypothetical protein